MKVKITVKIKIIDNDLIYLLDIAKVKIKIKDNDLIYLLYQGQDQD